MMMKAAILLLMFGCLFADADVYLYCTGDCARQAPACERRNHDWRTYNDMVDRHQEPLTTCKPSFGSVRYNGEMWPEMNITWSIDAGSELLRTTKKFILGYRFRYDEIDHLRLNPNMHNKFIITTVNDLVAGAEIGIQVHAMSSTGVTTMICDNQFSYPECCDTSYTRELEICSVAVNYCDRPYPSY